MVWTQDRPGSFRCIAHSNPTIVRTALVDLSFQDVVEPATYAANHKSSERVNSAPPGGRQPTPLAQSQEHKSSMQEHKSPAQPRARHMATLQRTVRQWGVHPASERPKLMTLIRPLIRLHLQVLKIPLPRRQISRGMLRTMSQSIDSRLRL